MNWRPSILSPAILILLIHSLIWHEHGQHGLVIPSFEKSGHADITLLESLLSSDTGEEHLEVYHASQALEETYQEFKDQTDHTYLIQFTQPFTKLTELRKKVTFPPRDMFSPKSIVAPNYRRGPPARV